MGGNDAVIDGDEALAATRVLPVADSIELTVLRTLTQAPGALPPAPPARDADMPGSHYELLGPVGAGAMGEVQAARDRELLRTVAYKRLHGAVETAPGVAQRFLIEAQLTAQLDHPNVVPVYALERDADGHIAYAMKLVRGRTLAELIAAARETLARSEPLPAELARETLIDHFLKVCDAIAYAHAKGVVHRDLKPSNIMIGTFHEVYVMDWGIALVHSAPSLATEAPEQAPPQLAEADPAGRTRCGDIIGTPAYMAPEQACGDAVDARADQYALGLILQELLTLRRAAIGHSAEEVLNARLRGERAPAQAPHGLPAVAPELAAVIARASALEPAARYADVTALAGDVRAWLRGEAVSALRDSLLRRTLRWVGRHRQATLVTLLLALLLGSLSSAGLLWRHLAMLERMQRRELLMARVLASGAAQAERIGDGFQQFDRLLEGLSSAASVALASNAAVPPADPAQPLPAAVKAPQYGGLAVDASAPSVQLATGSTPQAAAELGRLALLTPLLPRLYSLADDADRPQRDAAAMRHLVDEEETPLLWAVVGLASGGELRYPGVAGDLLGADYDVRTQSWYQLVSAAEGAEHACGHPFRSPINGELLLPCVQRVLAADGTLRGVAGLAFSLDILGQRLLLPKTPALAARLIDDSGHVIVHAGSAPLTETFEDAAVLQALAQTRSGIVERPGLWRVYAPVRALGWGYVVDFARDDES
ncbi:serine/threonine protein kinase [Plasticicumulans acidivorans]|uniref:Serine/threonine-protein kinase n=1 Tax=Plasticicumulans acidivorans TaxID=886464 RepID=A0A317MTG4_9GAMM|nr:serine/threonine protein kinase [Plasticicumulans acidivorans]PWV60222.1 serine/threonine-protein kinase [Plasticicumulans acidivorans]